MDKIFTDNHKDVWERPWDVEKFDDLYNRDERFFSILVKGLLNWLTRNISMYHKPIKHFIKDTGSAYLYVEQNGYEYTMNTTTGEDMIYASLPRCIVELGSINIPFEELTSPYANGTYERKSQDGNIKGYNAQIRRIPITWQINLHYVLANFNESIILIQELIDRVAFQQYFNITYLGQIIECSFEIPADYTINLNKIDMTSTETIQKTVDISLNVCANYPCIDDRTEVLTSDIIGNFKPGIELYKDNDINKVTDREDWHIHDTNK